MSAIPSRTDPSTAADAVPSAPVERTPTAIQQEKRPIERQIGTRGGERAKRFAARLRLDLQWIRQFLHGGK
jgi:hypothetical protein